MSILCKILCVGRYLVMMLRLRDLGILNKIHLPKILGTVFVFFLCVGETLAIGKHSRVCRKFKHGFQDVTDVRDVQEIKDAKCPPTSSAFNVYRVSAQTESENEDNIGNQCVIFNTPFSFIFNMS